jgi:hypothetical protein
MITRIRIAFTTGCVALLMTAAIGTHPSGVLSARALQRSAYRATRISSTQESEPERIASKESERIIAGRAKSVLQALKAGNIAKFSTFVHRQKGVRFSPYAQVLPDEDRVIKQNQLARMWNGKTRYKWGAYDGSGDPIRLTFRKYHRRFIFDHDFSRAERVVYNPEHMSRGNTPNNIPEIYPQSIAVEYHFSGFEERYSGHDWVSLWLVFEKKGSTWFVVGIVHDEWTI